MREHDIVAKDGTRLRVWRTESDGPPILLCPGLGTMPEAWPALVLPESGVDVLSWYHRGTMGSERPANSARITLDDHVSDAIAVLDDAGVHRTVVLGWSMGVMVATELARRHPGRVSGLLLAAGVPGDLFGGIGGVLGLPLPLRRTLARNVARLARAASPLVNAVLHHVPVNEVTANLLQHSGFMLPGASPAAVATALRRFLMHDWGWYVNLALGVGSVPRQDLAGITCPLTVLVGRYDVLADPHTAIAPTAALPQARVRIVPTSHFVPLEAPEVVSDELALLVERAAAVRRTLNGEEPVPPSEPRRPAVARALTRRSRTRV